MKGTILDYSVENGIGSISGDDGKSYEFSSNDWIDSKLQPEKNVKVDFDIQETTAINILPIEKESMEEKTSEEINTEEKITEEKKPEEKKAKTRKFRIQWGGVFSKLGILVNNLLLLSIVLLLWKSNRDQQLENIEKAQGLVNSIKVEQLGESFESLEQAKTNVNEALKLVDKIPDYPTYPYEEAQATKVKINEKLKAIQENEKLLLANDDKAKEALKSAMTIATEAVKISSNPPHTVVIWEQARNKWQQAIKLLESAPKPTSIAKEIEEKINAYQNNLKIVNQKIEDEKQAKLTFDSGLNNATRAFTLTKDNPKDISIWIQSYQEWQNALTNLKKIPNGTTFYTEGNAKINEYQKNLDAVILKIKQLESTLNQSHKINTSKNMA